MEAERVGTAVGIAIVCMAVLGGIATFVVWLANRLRGTPQPARPRRLDATMMAVGACLGILSAMQTLFRSGPVAAAFDGLMSVPLWALIVALIGRLVHIVWTRRALRVVASVVLLLGLVGAVMAVVMTKKSAGGPRELTREELALLDGRASVGAYISASIYNGTSLRLTEVTIHVTGQFGDQRISRPYRLTGDASTLTSGTFSADAGLEGITEMKWAILSARGRSDQLGR